VQFKNNRLGVGGATVPGTGNSSVEQAMRGSLMRAQRNELGRNDD